MLRTTSTLLKILLCISFLLGGSTIYASDLQLKKESFERKKDDLSAMVNPVLDNNQEKCALIIISGTGVEPLSFDVGNAYYHVEDSTKNGETVYHLYVAAGAKKLSIFSRSNPATFEPLKDLSLKLKKAETYELKLELSKAKDVVNQQILEFKLNPSDAEIEVNGEPWQVENGLAYKQVKKGKYQYSVHAKDYYPETDVVKFNDLSSKKQVQVNLKPNFGWVTLSSPLQDIEVYVDNNKIDGDISQIKLPSGKHTIKVTKDMYLPFTQTVEIEDDINVPLTLHLEPNYSHIKLITKDNSEIYLDDKLLDKGSWAGKLEPGSYSISIKKEGYKTQADILKVPKAGQEITKEFKELEPVYGTINIDSNPPRASVIIDAKNYGKTPLPNVQVQVGSHIVVLSLNGYESKRDTIWVEEEKSTNLSYDLKQELTPRKTSPKISSSKPKTSDLTRPNHTSNVKPSNGTKQYGIVDFNEIISSYPKAIDIDQQVAQMTKKIQQDYNKLKDELSQKYKSYQNNPSQKLQDEIIDLNAKVEAFSKDSQDNVNNFREKEMTIIYRTIQQAIQQVSEELGLEFVVPSGAPLYVGPDVTDITKQVQNKLKP